MYYSFQDLSCLYLVMEFLPGGWQMMKLLALIHSFMIFFITTTHWELLSLSWWSDFPEIKLSPLPRPGFYPSTFVYSRFLPEVQFLYCLFNYLHEVLPWWLPKGKSLKIRSPDCWKIHFQHSFWLQKHRFHILCLQRQQFFLEL